MNILAIESSCDETAAAVVRDGRTVLSNCVASQIEMHTIYGGVVPEIASRKHVEAVSGLAREALERAGLSREEVDLLENYVLTWSLEGSAWTAQKPCPTTPRAGGGPSRRRTGPWWSGWMPSAAG